VSSSGGSIGRISICCGTSGSICSSLIGFSLTRGDSCDDDVLFFCGRTGTRLDGIFTRMPG
jgi:hypothetical protein